MFEKLLRLLLAAFKSIWRRDEFLRLGNQQRAEKTPDIFRKTSSKPNIEKIGQIRVTDVVIVRGISASTVQPARAVAARCIKLV